MSACRAVTQEMIAAPWCRENNEDDDACRELEREAYTLGGTARTGSRIVHMRCSNVRFDFPGASMEKYQLAGFKFLQALIRFDDATRLQVR